MLADASVSAAEYLTDGEPHPMVSNIEGIACEVLINNDGSGNFEAINKIREAGYNVFASDKDSFSWLTGCISTPKGIIVYG